MVQLSYPHTTGKITSISSSSKMLLMGWRWCTTWGFQSNTYWKPLWRTLWTRRRGRSAGWDSRWQPAIKKLPPIVPPPGSSIPRVAANHFSLPPTPWQPCHHSNSSKGIHRFLSFLSNSCMCTASHSQSDHNYYTSILNTFMKLALIWSLNFIRWFRCDMLLSKCESFKCLYAAASLWW